MQGGTVTLKNVAEIASWYIYLTNSNMLRRDGHRQARCPVTARTWSRSARSRIVTSSTAKPPSSGRPRRSEEHTSELQSLLRLSYAVFCVTNIKKQTRSTKTTTD